jgi:hypothetical protein
MIDLAGAGVVISTPVTPHTDDEKFLRAAIKAGLRLQQRSASAKDGSPAGERVAVLQRIKASLRRRQTRLKSNP